MAYDLKRRLDDTEAKLRKSFDLGGAPMCPRPINGRLDGPLLAAECIAAGECGCDLKRS